jgi:hypothetical protein
MVTFSGDRGASAWFRAASGGTWAVVTPRIRCGEGASDPGTARPGQQASRRSEAVCRHSCTTQVERVPDQQHHVPLGVCGAEEQSQRRSGVRRPRRLERRSRGAHRAKRCRLPEEVQVGQQKVRAAKTAPLLKAAGGPTMKDVEVVRAPPRRHTPKQRSWRPRCSSCRTRSSSSSWQQQPPCQSQRREAVRVERRVARPVLGAGV